MTTTRAKVLHVEDEGSGLRGLAAAAEAALNGFLAESRIGPDQVRGLSCVQVSTSEVTPEPGSYRDVVSVETGLLVTVLYADSGKTTR